jgi:hypothetical protein
MRRLQKLLTPAAIIFTALLLSACGSGRANTTSSGASDNSTQNAAVQTQNSSAGEVVARVGTTPITTAEVNHWMNALGATLFYRDSGSRTLPEGLLSDPPNYPRCVSGLEAAATTAPAKGHESAVELLAKCRELDQSLKVYATSHLIAMRQNIQIANEMGATTTSSKVQSVFEQEMAREYPTPAALHAYLVSHRHTISDELLETQVQVLGTEVFHQLKTPRGHSRYLALQARASAVTTCSPGYIVEGCKQFKGSLPHTTASIVMEDLARTA